MEKQQDNFPESSQQEDGKISLTAQSCFQSFLDNSLNHFEKDVIKTSYELCIAELIFPNFLAKPLESIIIESREESNPSIKSLIFNDILEEATISLISIIINRFQEQINLKTKLNMNIREKIMGKYVGSKTIAIAKTAILNVMMANSAYNQILEKNIQKICCLSKNCSEFRLNELNNPLNDELFNEFLLGTTQKLVNSEYYKKIAENEIANGFYKENIIDSCEEVAQGKDKKKLNYLVANDLLKAIRELVKEIVINSLKHLKVVIVVERVIERRVFAKLIEHQINNISQSELTSKTLYSDLTNSEISNKILSSYNHNTSINYIWPDLLLKELTLQCCHLLALNIVIEDLIGEQSNEITLIAYKAKLNSHATNAVSDIIFVDVMKLIIVEEYDCTKTLCCKVVDNMVQTYTNKYIEECFRWPRMSTIITGKVGSAVLLRYFQNYYNKACLASVIYNNYLENYLTNSKFNILIAIPCNEQILEGVFLNFLKDKIETFKEEHEILQEFMSNQIISTCNTLFMETFYKVQILTELNEEIDLYLTQKVITEFTEQIFTTQLIVGKEVWGIQERVEDIAQDAFALALTSVKVVNEACEKNILPEIISKEINNTLLIKQISYEIVEEKIKLIVDSITNIIKDDTYLLALVQNEQYDILLAQISKDFMFANVGLYLDIAKDFISQEINSFCQISLYNGNIIYDSIENLCASEVTHFCNSSYELAFLAFESNQSLTNLFVNKFILEICEDITQNDNIQSVLTNDLIDEVNDKEIKKLVQECILCQMLENELIETEISLISISAHEMNCAALSCTEEFITTTITDMCNVSYVLSLMTHEYFEENNNTLIESQIGAITENIHSSYIAYSQITEEICDELILSENNKYSNNAILCDDLLDSSLETIINNICQRVIENNSIIIEYIEEMHKPKAQEMCECSLRLYLDSHEKSNDLESMILKRQTNIVAMNAFYKTGAIIEISSKMSLKSAIKMKSEIMDNCLAVKEIYMEFIETEIIDFCQSNTEIASITLSWLEPLIQKISKVVILNSYIMPNLTKKCSIKIIDRSVEEQIGVTVINSALERLVAIPISDFMYEETKRVYMENLAIESIISEEIKDQTIEKMIISCCKAQFEIETIYNIVLEELICSAHNTMCGNIYYRQLLFIDLLANFESSEVQDKTTSICNSSFYLSNVIVQEIDGMIAELCEKTIENSYYNPMCASHYMNSFLLYTMLVSDIYLWMDKFSMVDGVSQEVYDTLERDYIISLFENIFTEHYRSYIVQNEIAELFIEDKIMESVNICIWESQISDQIAESYIKKYLLSLQDEFYSSGNYNYAFYLDILNSLISSQTKDNLIQMNILEDIINSSISENELDTFPSTNKPQSFVGKIAQSVLFENKIKEIEFYKMLDKITYELMCKPCYKFGLIYKKNSTVISRSFYTDLINRQINEVIMNERVIKDITTDIINSTPISLTENISSNSYNSLLANKDIIPSLESSMIDYLLKQELIKSANYASETLQLVELFYEDYLLYEQSTICENSFIDCLTISNVLNDFIRNEISDSAKEIYGIKQLRKVATTLISDQFIKRKVLGVIQCIYLQEEDDNKSRKIVYNKLEEHMETSLIPEVCGVAIWEYKFALQYIEMLSEEKTLQKLNNSHLNNLLHLEAFEFITENVIREICEERLEKANKVYDVAKEINVLFIEHMIWIQAKVTVDSKKHSIMLAKYVRDRYYSKWMADQSKAIRETKYRNCLVIKEVYEGLLKRVIIETYNNQFNWKKRKDINTMVAKEIYNKLSENMVEYFITEPLYLKEKMEKEMVTEFLEQKLLETANEINYINVSAVEIAESMIGDEMLIRKIYDEISQDNSVSVQLTQKMLSREGYLGKITEEIICRNIEATMISKEMLTSQSHLIMEYINQDNGAEIASTLDMAYNKELIHKIFEEIKDDIAMATLVTEDMIGDKRLIHDIYGEINKDVAVATQVLDVMLSSKGYLFKIVVEYIKETITSEFIFDDLEKEDIKLIVKKSYQDYAVSENISADLYSKEGYLNTFVKEINYKAIASALIYENMLTNDNNVIVENVYLANIASLELTNERLSKGGYLHKILEEKDTEVIISVLYREDMLSRNGYLHKILEELNEEVIISKLISDDILTEQTNKNIVKRKGIQELAAMFIEDFTSRIVSNLAKNQISKLRVGKQVSDTFGSKISAAFINRITSKQLQEYKYMINGRNTFTDKILTNLLKKSIYGYFLKDYIAFAKNKKWLPPLNKSISYNIRTGCYLSGCVSATLLIRVGPQFLRQICSDAIDEASELEMQQMDNEDEHPAATTEIRKSAVMPTRSFWPSPEKEGPTFKCLNCEKQIPITDIETHTESCVKIIKAENEEAKTSSYDNVNKELIKISSSIDKKIKTLELKTTINSYKTVETFKKINTILLNALKNNHVKI